MQLEQGWRGGASPLREAHQEEKHCVLNARIVNKTTIAVF